MYKLFLCLRYLRRRYIALVAIVGMALCVFMVLVVVSVFDGFLATVENAARGMMGDVIVDSSGLPRYEHLLDELHTLPEVKTATPIIYAYGLVRVGPMYTHYVRVVGMRLPEATQVSTFGQGLWPDELKANPKFEMPPGYVQNLDERFRLDQRELEQEIAHLDGLLKQAAALPPGKVNPEAVDSVKIKKASRERELKALPAQMQYDPALPSIILGIDIPGTTERDSATGEYTRLMAVGKKVQLMLLPFARSYNVTTEPRNKIFTFIGDSRLGIYGIDNLQVYVDFDVLQKLVDMDARQGVESEPGRPAMCSEVQIKLLPAYLGASLNADGNRLVVRQVVEHSPAAKAGLAAGDFLTSVDGKGVSTVDDVHDILANKHAGSSLAMGIDRQGKAVRLEAHLGDPRQAAQAVQAMYDNVSAQFPDMERSNSSIQTWEQKQASYVEPIEKQRTLTAIMFSIISLVAVVLVFAIFYMMVVQRTRDVGVLKSIGGSSIGVAGIYLMYGCAIGLVGSAAGAIGGYFFIRNINPIHDWVADTFHYRLFDRQSYLFDTIPNQVEPSVIVTIIIGAILAGLIGSVLPALRAARMQPVEALRYE